MAAKRLTLSSYIRVILAYSFLIIEPILRILFAILPLRILADFLRRRLAFVFGPPPSMTNSETDDAANSNEKLVSKFLTLHSTEDFLNYWGFPFQTHYVTTKDGYILSLHRIPCSRSEFANAKSRLRARVKSIVPQPRPVVLLWHGFLMCSEVWVSTPDFNESLAFTLAEAGYDVWLGNTRGNKYSCKHRKHKPSEETFWDFSMDQLALFDLPDSIDYILNFTGAPSLTYIGFSQGSAQGFSSLSLNVQLNKKINLFIALAPATKPKGLQNETIHSLVNASPEIIFLLFGYKALLSSVLFWQSILSPPTFSWIIDVCMWGLFGWDSEFMPYKSVVYRHLYSYTSVKCVVHWFQIMKTGVFQMFDDSPPVLPGSSSKNGYHVPHYPTNQIRAPIAIFYGGKDTLPDMPYILDNIREPVYCLDVREYEHLQFLWGSGKDKVVFPAILGLLHEYSEAWFDTHDGQSNSTASQASGGVGGAKTVSWITQDQISDLLELGRLGGSASFSPSIPGSSVGGGGEGSPGSKMRMNVASVSVAKALDYGFVNLADH